MEKKLNNNKKNFSQTIFEGRLARDPEEVFSEKGTKHVRMYLVSNRGAFYGYDVFILLAYKTWARVAMENLSKGASIIVRGRAKNIKRYNTRNWMTVWLVEDIKFITTDDRGMEDKDDFFEKYKQRIAEMEGKDDSESEG